ncbi:FmdB family zinc ribbon protein [Yersinia aldovae]|uniref:hypothetical protein n=1 Tax=Yersinia aldovae TaxID=29483 RepID=UPI001E5FB40A|nr:hypothetical protein [Yersinia aldovae]
MTQCPACHQPALTKLISAAGIQLQGPVGTRQISNRAVTTNQIIRVNQTVVAEAQIRAHQKTAARSAERVRHRLSKRILYAY